MTNKKYSYEGSLYKYATPKVRKAVECFRNQVARCNNPKNPRFKDNGAKGIKVDYAVREFVGWFLIAIEKYHGVSPSVGRKDHSKGYSFDNIQIESLADNSTERIQRVGPTKPRRKIAIYLNDNFFRFAESGFEAANITGVQKSHIPRYCQGVLKKSVKGYSFKYA